MNHPAIIPLKPKPIKDRVSMTFVYYGRIDVKDGGQAKLKEIPKFVILNFGYCDLFVI
jgi:hypothetical protein